MKDVDNQHGNLQPMQEYFEVMAYSIGAMIGDGSVKEYINRSLEKDKFIRVHNAGISGMDLECLERVCQEVFQLFGKIYVPKAYKNPKGTQMYRVGFGNILTYSFFNYFIKDKSFLPDEVFRASRKAKLDFLAGLFDIDGHVAMSQHKHTKSGYAWRVGYAARIRTLVEDIARLLMKLGVKVGKIHEQVSGYGTLMYIIKPNIRSFIEKGCYFHIKRKAKKLALYELNVGPQSYGNSKTFRDYNVEPLTQG